MHPVGSVSLFCSFKVFVRVLIFFYFFHSVMIVGDDGGWVLFIDIM